MFGKSHSTNIIYNLRQRGKKLRCSKIKFNKWWVLYMLLMATVSIADEWWHCSCWWQLLYCSSSEKVLYVHSSSKWDITSKSFSFVLNRLPLSSIYAIARWKEIVNSTILLHHNAGLNKFYILVPTTNSKTSKCGHMDFFSQIAVKCRCWGLE